MLGMIFGIPSLEIPAAGGGREDERLLAGGCGGEPQRGPTDLHGEAAPWEIWTWGMG